MRARISDTLAKWSYIGVIAAIVFIWLCAAGLTLAPQWQIIGLLLGFGIVTLSYRFVRPNQRIAEFAETFVQLLVFSLLAVILSYLMAAAGFPLTDRYLAAADAVIGFNWLAVFDWLNERPRLKIAAEVAYNSFAPQVLLVMVLLNATGRLQRAREFVTLHMACTTLIVPWSLFFPAASAWAHFGVAHLAHAYHLEDFMAIRSGAMTEIKMSAASGLVTFPSLHTTYALAFVYITRGIRHVAPIAMTLNAAMLAATPIIGGHYFVDVLAGAALFPLAVMLTRYYHSCIINIDDPVRWRTVEGSGQPARIPSNRLRSELPSPPKPPSM